MSNNINNRLGELLNHGDIVEYSIINVETKGGDEDDEDCVTVDEFLKDYENL